MNKTKEAIVGKDRWEDLNSYISLVEENINDNSNIALEGSKSLLESISKTILKDKSIPYKSDSKIGFLVKKAFESLPVFVKLSDKEVGATKSILGSFENIARNIGEFRNDYGFFAHGQDIQAEKFDRYLVELAISSVDLLASFLIISHAEDLNDRKRLYYDEYPDFNKWFDENEEWPMVKGIELSPSKTLFYNDIDYYKQELLAFENNPDVLIPVLEHAENKEEIVENIVNIKNILSEVQLRNFNKILKQQKELSIKMQENLKSSGVIDAMNRLNLNLVPAIENINKINKVLIQKREYIKENLHDEIIEEYKDDLQGQQQCDEMRDK